MSHCTLVYRDLEFSDKTEVLEFLANKLYEEKFVKEGYEEAILKREAEYPTALPAEIKIAIPHCDHTLVNIPAIAMGILKNQVDFQAMDDPDMTLGVQIVMMLALNEPHGHIEMLQKIISLIQNSDDLKKILKCKSDEDVLTIVKEYLN